MESSILSNRNESPVTSGRFRAFIANMSHLLALSVVVGVISGALAGGLGSRIAIRISGFLALADSANKRYMLTEAGTRVGKITLDGTMFLVLSRSIPHRLNPLRMSGGEGEYVETSLWVETSRRCGLIDLGPSV